MKFYHFTAVAKAEAILSEGLSRGHIKHGDGSICQPVVWLTTDPEVEGHGVLTGREKMSDRNAAYLTRVNGKAPKNGIFANHQRIRLTFDLSPDDGTLIPFVDYYASRGEKPAEAKLMGISAYLENPWALPLARKRHLIKTMATKEGTWWLSFMPIPAAKIRRVEYNGADGFVDYDFEQHGRRPFHDSGFVAPRAETLSSLSALIPNSHSFDRPKAFAYCADPKHDANVVVRGGGRQCAFRLTDGSALFGMDHPNGTEISAWVRQNSAELKECWERAIDLFYTYHPEQGRTGLSIRLNP